MSTIELEGLGLTLIDANQVGGVTTAKHFTFRDLAVRRATCLKGIPSRGTGLAHYLLHTLGLGCGVQNVRYERVNTDY